MNSQQSLQGENGELHFPVYKSADQAVIDGSRKVLSTVREWGLARGWVRLHCATEMLLDFKTDPNGKPKMRKDGKTPSHMHEILEVYYLHTLLGNGLQVSEPEIKSILLMMHDVKEDVKGYDEAKIVSEITTAWESAAYPSADKNTHCRQMSELGDSIYVISKKDMQGHIYYDNKEDFFVACMSDEHASVAKLIDFMQNHSTACDVMDTNRILSDIQFCYDTLFPLIDEAKETFPHQAGAYDELKNEIHLINQIYNGEVTEEHFDDNSAFSSMPRLLRPAYIAFERKLNNPEMIPLDAKAVIRNNIEGLKPGLLY